MTVGLIVQVTLLNQRDPDWRPESWFLGIWSSCLSFEKTDMLLSCLAEAEWLKHCVSTVCNMMLDKMECKCACGYVNLVDEGTVVAEK